MKIALGSDHVGYALKTLIIEHLSKRGIECRDFGASNGEQGANYITHGKAVAQAVQSGDADFGIVICGSGVGISLIANKFKGIRAVLCNCEYVARVCRSHNNANVLALGATVTGRSLGLAIVDAFLAEPFDTTSWDGWNKARIDELTAFESSQFRS